MIFGSKSISTFTRANMTLWMILAFQAGMLNIAGLLSCHGFVSNMTGYATLFGFELGQKNFLFATAAVFVPFCFMLGAVFSGYLIDVRLKKGDKPQYFVVFGVLFLILLSITIVGFNKGFGSFGVSDEAHANYYLLACLCLACGMQNGTVTLVSKSVVRTTHITGLTTDLGIGLVRVWSADNRESVINERRDNRMRMGIIFFFATGSLVGYFAFQAWRFQAFTIPTVIYGLLFFLMVYFQLIKGQDKRLA
jgi:uncharacterized membrane protein YoaK (UPF0700 family)